MAYVEAQGSVLYWSTTTAASTSASNVVGQIVGFTGPGGSGSKIDVTNLASTAREFYCGLRDEGDVTLDVLYDPADVGQAALFADRASRTRRKAVIVLSSTGVHKMIFDAFCMGFSVNGSVDNMVKASITLAVTGPVSVATAIA